MVFKLYKQVIGAGAHERVDIEIKRVVAVAPQSRFLAVDIDYGIAHGTVKKEGEISRRGVSHVKCRAIRAFSYKWESACTSGLPGLFFLSVLFHGNTLYVVFAIKRTVYRPVVGYCDFLPLCIGGRDALGKFPFFQCD